MANISVSSDSNLSDITYSAGDSLDIGGSATLTIDESSLDLSLIYCQSTLRRLKFSNSSTTDIIILNMTGDISANTGTLEMDTGFIPLSSPFVVPVDSAGNRPSCIGFFVNSGERYIQCESLSDMFADERGLHFLYDSSTGVITVGDDINGKIPTGDIQISNFYAELNNNDLGLSAGSLIGSGATVFNTPKFSADHLVNVDTGTYWAICNNNGNYAPTNLKKNKTGNFSFILTGSNNRKITLGETTSTDHIVYSIEAIPSSERVLNAYRPLNGIIEARYLTQPASKQGYAYTSLFNNGGTATVIDLGGNKNVFELEGGVGGQTYIKYSTGYRRTDGGFYVGISVRNSDAEGSITGFERIGSEAWPDQAQHFILATSGKINVGSVDQDIIFPADADFYEILNLAADSEGSINRVINNGTSARSTRDYNTYAQRGWTLSNFKMLNDSNHGNQTQSNTDYHFVSMIGNTPKFGEGATNSEIITNSTGDQGSVWMHPSTVISGSVTFNASKLYYAPNTVVEQQSDIISGVGIATAINVVGSTTGNFTIEYKIWKITETEPSTYTSFTLGNVQTSQSTYTDTTKWFLKYRITKNASALSSGYLNGIEIQCPFDPAFIWTTPVAALPITIPNIIDGTRVVVINYTRSTLFEDIIIAPALIDNIIVTGGAGYSTEVRVGGSEVTQSGDVILIKANWQSGTQAKLPLRIFAVMTESGISLIDSLVDSSNGGELTANLTDVEVDIDDDNNIFDCRRGIAWWRWVNTTAQGALIYDALGLVYKPDEYNIQLQGRLKIKNSKVGSRLQVINGIWTHYLGESILADDTETIRWVPNDRLYNSNDSQITDIKATVDAYLDAAISSRATQTSVDNISVSIVATDIHTALDSYTSKDDYKADLTGIATTANVTALNDFNPSIDVVANVTLVDTVTTNTDMRGTDSALLNASYTAPDNASISLILGDTNELQGNQGNWLTADVTGLVSIQSDIDEILANHNNPTYYFGIDGTTRVELPEAYYISLRSVDGLTEIRRISAVDSSNNPINFLQTTGYN